MPVLVEKSSTEPVYSQIARQIRERILAGGLRPGQDLPAVRSLAQDLGINLNTVARAYRQLEQEGFVRIRSRSGAEVVPPQAAPKRPECLRMTEELRKLLARMRQAGLVPQELREIARVEIGRLEQEPTKESS